MMKLVVEIALTWFASQCQFVFAVGIVMVQPPEVGAVPVKMLKEPVPLGADIVAADPPQPAAAIVGAVVEIKQAPVLAIFRQWFMFTPLLSALRIGPPPSSHASAFTDDAALT